MYNTMVKCIVYKKYKKESQMLYTRKMFATKMTMSKKQKTQRQKEMFYVFYYLLNTSIKVYIIYKNIYIIIIAVK